MTKQEIADRIDRLLRESQGPAVHQRRILVRELDRLQLDIERDVLKEAGQ